MYPVMNNTKWEELRLAMHGLGNLHPQWRTKSTDSDFVSPWEGEWFYHFYAGGYKDIEWVEIKVSSSQQDAVVLSALKAIHVPGQKTDVGYKLYGYLTEGKPVEYI